MDHASLQSSENVWRAITRAASVARKFPQNELWRAIDRNLPEKSSAVKVVVQAKCVERLEHPALQEWKRLARVAARGAHALFRAATDGWESKENYEPFALVGKRSEVVVTDEAREAWEEGLAAHEELLAREDFGALTPEEMGGLFLLTHTPDNWVKAVSSFGFDYWWLRILHLSIERNADLRIGDFALVKAWKGDAEGNLIFRKTSRNHNPAIATAGKVTIAEVEELVPTGELPPDSVHLPGIYVDRIVQGHGYERYIERLTLAGEPSHSCASADTGHVLGCPARGSRRMPLAKPLAALFGLPGRMLTVGRRSVRPSTKPLRE